MVWFVSTSPGTTKVAGCSLLDLCLDHSGDWESLESQIMLYRDHRGVAGSCSRQALHEVPYLELGKSAGVFLFYPTATHTPPPFFPIFSSSK